jgi:hypothetical protein
LSPERRLVTVQLTEERRQPPSVATPLKEVKSKVRREQIRRCCPESKSVQAGVSRGRRRRVPLVPVLHNDTGATPPDASRTPSSTRSLPELELQTAPHPTRRAGVAGDRPDRQSSGELSTSFATKPSRRTRSVDPGEAAVAPVEPAEAARVDQAGAAGTSGADKGGAVAGREVEEREHEQRHDAHHRGGGKRPSATGGAPGHVDSVLRHRPEQRDAPPASSPRRETVRADRRVRDSRRRSDERGPDY